MMGRLYFYDKKTKQYDFILDWKNYSGNSYTMVEWKIRDRVEEITGWEYNKQIFSSSDSLAFNGQANYGKRGLIYDIDNERNADVKRHIKIDEIID